MATVKDLRDLLMHYPPEMVVEFHDKTTGRRCPINSHSMASRPKSDTVLLLHNTLPRTFGVK